jgi:probable F420-dependent oxidoreductase
MKLGVTIPNNWGIADPRRVIESGRLAEELGFDSVWVMDHLLNVGFIRERLEDRPYYHPLSILSYLAAVTQRVTLGTSVIVMPYHDPVELAKYAATLDQLSGGRLVLGLGVGGMPEEFAALGIALRDRRRLTDEAIRMMTALWTQPAIDYERGRWHMRDVRFSPKPLQRPRIPLWIGGGSPGALKRAATLGDGWHPNALSSEEYAAGRDEVRRLATAAGRDPDAVTLSVRVAVEVTPPRGSYGAGRYRLPKEGKQIVAVLQAFAQAGVEHVVLALDSSDVDAIADTMQMVAKEVAPALR